MKRISETDRFTVKSDKGNEYIIIQYQEYISTSSSSGFGEVEGLKSLATSTGLDVNYINPTTFKIVQTGGIAHKI